MSQYKPANNLKNDWSTYISIKTFGIKQIDFNKRTSLSNYEKLSFIMLGCSWGILVLVVASLHIGNYHLETKTSSTSGTHNDFANK